jgi:hypothetical protein
MTENIKQNKTKEYAFVLDSNGNKLSPTNINKAWILIRKQKVILIQKYPMVIQLKREIKTEELDECKYIVGIDDGSIHVGISIVQECKTKNKPVFKGTIEQRKDVKGLMDTRRGYRRYKRSHKRYRKARFDNRSASIRKCRIAPSIKQKKDAILRVINRLNKYINISEYHLEDVAIDIRALTEGKKLYRWQYQKTNRLDENIRKAVILRDNCKCMECGKTNCVLEVHHIKPKRLKGSNTIDNLITLCGDCHDKTEGNEERFISRYQSIINGKNIRFDYAQHVMQGKTYLRQKIIKLGKLILTTGGDTANKRIDCNVGKSHSNDSIVITDLIVNSKDCNIKDWIIKPMRRKSMIQKEHKHNFKHGDVVKYKNRKCEIIKGRITSMRKSNGSCKIIDFQGEEFGPIVPKSLSLIWRYNKIYFI